MKAALIGLGSVGRGVAEMIAAKDPGITITGIADSKSGCICNDGIDITAVLENKKQDRGLRRPGDCRRRCDKKSRLRCPH